MRVICDENYETKIYKMNINKCQGMQSIAPHLFAYAMCIHILDKTQQLHRQKRITQNKNIMDNSAK